MTMCNPGDQGGMNDQGLFYDWNALTPRTIQPDPNKEDYPYYLAYKILRECATVQEVLAMYEQYNEPIFSRAQIQWVDATGASVICGYGETEYEYQLKTGAFQVSTNFNVLTGESPDWRFTTATTWLTNWRNISEALFSHILTLVSQSNTVYSNVHDLNTGDVYFYCHYPDEDFANVALVNIHDELALGTHIVYLTSLTYETRNDVIPPAASVLDPPNNDLSVQPGDNLYITFTETVYQGSGNITIKRFTTDQTIEVIDIGDVGGLGTNTLTINPSQNFVNGYRYYVLIDDTCLVDADGLPYHGMPIKDSWRFGIVP